MPTLEAGDLLTAREASEVLRLATGTLANMRCQGRGPRHLSLGTAVRYRRSDLSEWVESQQRTGRAA